MLCSLKVPQMMELAPLWLKLMFHNTFILNLLCLFQASPLGIDGANVFWFIVLVLCSAFSGVLEISPHLHILKRSMTFLLLSINLIFLAFETRKKLSVHYFTISR